MNQTTTNILSTFENFRMTPSPIDQYESIGKSILADRIDGFTKRNAPIDFVMLGFPFKSTNSRDKVLGKIPDKAEEVTMKNFKRFNDEIKKTYAPGTSIHIASDGFAFNDLLEVEDRVVDEYKEISEDMARGIPVHIHSLRDFYKDSLLTAKGKMMDQFGISPLELEQNILLNPDVNWLYRGMIIFMGEELAMKSFESKSQHQKAAKKLAREMMFRNEAFSNLVRNNFSSMIRLSMHPSVNNGNKYSFQLIPGVDVKHSAWHCSLIIDKSNNFSTMHKKDAIANGYELVYQNNKPYYFQA